MSNTRMIWLFSLFLTGCVSQWSWAQNKGKEPGTQDSPKKTTKQNAPKAPLTPKSTTAPKSGQSVPSKSTKNKKSGMQGAKNPKASKVDAKSFPKPQAPSSATPPRPVKTRAFPVAPVKVPPRVRKKRKKNEFRLIHQAPFSAEGHRALEITAQVSGEWKVSKIRLFYQLIGTTDLFKVLFRRNTEGDYVARIPKEHVTTPGFAYYIDSVDLKGKVRYHFGTPNRLHRVLVRTESGLGQFLRRLRRHDGFRSSVGASFEINTFGSHPAFRRGGPPAKSTPPEFFDYYYRLELWYSYRMLSTFYELSFGFGHMRGEVPLDSSTIWGVSGTAPSDIYEAGMDYGFSKVFIHLHHYFGVEAKVLLGASAEGFEGGFGLTARIGNLLETHLDLGFEVVSGMGYSLFFELAWDTVPNFIMALRAEVSNMPFFTDELLASKAYYKILWKPTQRFHAFLHIGYGRRRLSTGGSIIGKAGVITNF